MITFEQAVDFGSGVAAAFGIGFGFYQQYHRKKAKAQAATAMQAAEVARDAQRIIDVKDELIRVAQESKEAWKSKYEDEHLEFAKYREDCHARVNDAQGKILQLTAENAEYRVKTDLTPVLKHQEEQTRINQEILRGLQAINASQQAILNHFEASSSPRQKLINPKMP